MAPIAAFPAGREGECASRVSPSVVSLRDAYGWRQPPPILLNTKDLATIFRALAMDDAH